MIMVLDRHAEPYRDLALKGSDESMWVKAPRNIF
jgi:hypothetical protein